MSSFCSGYRDASKRWYVWSVAIPGLNALNLSSVLMRAALCLGCHVAACIASKFNAHSELQRLWINRFSLLDTAWWNFWTPTQVSSTSAPSRGPVENFKQSRGLGKILGPRHARSETSGPWNGPGKTFGPSPRPDKSSAPSPCLEVSPGPKFENLIRILF